MANEIKLKSNLKIINTRTEDFKPSASQLPKGNVAVGKIAGKYKIFANTDDSDGVQELLGGGAGVI